MTKNTSTKNESGQLEGAWAATGFSLVLILVGLPIWWWTTTVYRAGLPYSSIDELTSRSPYHTLHLSIISNKPFSFKNDIDSILKSSDHVKFLISYRPPDPQESRILQFSKSIEELDFGLGQKRVYHAGTLSLYFLPEAIFSSLSVNGSSVKSVFVSKKRALYFHEDINLEYLSTIINAMAIDPVAKLGFGRDLKKVAIESNIFQVMRQVPTEPEYDITLTLMLPQPHILKAQWNVSQAVQDYLNPLVKQLERIAKLQIRSQVLYMTSMKISPKWSSKYKHYSLPEQQLPLTVNAIEAKLGSFVSTRPALHFITYVPSEFQSPLQIHSKDGEPLHSNSFLVPRWGGIMIHNPPAELVANKDESELPRVLQIDSERVMSIIISQLHKLFPIPSLENEKDVVLIGEKETSLLTDWQLDGLARARGLAYLHNIRITLQSLCDLVGEISNMVVSDEVAGWVWAAVNDWRACLDASREGRIKEATEDCKSAFSFSDAAFFHPSMLALLYFPDNQKYAIYVPLFLPVSIPVVLSLRTILKLFRKHSTKLD